MSVDKLTMTFEPNTIEHLGVKMYSTLPPALAEMIANAYDACSTKVTIDLFDENENNKKIIIEDNGIGMSFQEVNDYFLRIGRNRRDEGMKEAQCKRIASGKKGLGKLALFGIGETIVIETIQNKKKVKFTLDWAEIMACKDTHYSPKFELTDSELGNGTKITLQKLKRKTHYSLDSLSFSLSMLFNFWEKDFQVFVSLNGSDPVLLDNKLKYDNINSEFKWEYKDFVGELEMEYDHKAEITGVIMTTEKPLKPGLRGITLFANGRMVNSPDFFGQSESSHFFSYTTGWLNVDFVDNWEEDVISTNRQSIDWDGEKTDQLRKYLRECLNLVERKWRKKRKEKRVENIEEKTHVNLKEWYKTLPPEVLDKIEKIVNSVDESELLPETQADLVQSLHMLVPEYPYYHWRHLNESIRAITKDDYEKQDYLRAAEEAIKLYETQVHQKGEIDDVGVSLMGKSFGENNEPLKITANITMTDKNIERGQKHMSMGVMSGFRNPAMHNPKTFIHPAIFDDNDCLDLLSMISYLTKKLEISKNIVKKWTVQNVTDGILASPDLMTTLEADGFIAEFPNKFRAQGFYLTASGEKIKPEDVVLKKIENALV